MSPLRSSAGPAVCTNGTPSSAATICASEVLPSPGGPASSTWSSASPRAVAASIATASCSLQLRLADELLEAPRPQRHLELVLGGEVGRLDALAHAHRASAPAPRRAQRRRQQLLGASRPRRRRAAARPPAARSPSSSSPSRASSRGVVAPAPARRTTISSPIAAPTFSRSSTMIRSAVRLPTPGHGLEEARVAGRDRAEHGARPARRRAPRARASGRPPGRRAAAGTGRARPASAKPTSTSASSRTIRCVCSVASRADRADARRASARRPPGGSRRRRTSASRARRRARRPRRGASRSSRGRRERARRAARGWRGRSRPRARRRRDRRCGGARQREQRGDHPRDLVLRRAPAAADRALDLLGRVGEARDAALAGAQHRHAARLADGEGGARVLRRSRGSRAPSRRASCSRSSAAERFVQLAEALLDARAGARSRRRRRRARRSRPPRRSTTP